MNKPKSVEPGKVRCQQREDRVATGGHDREDERGRGNKAGSGSVEHGRQSRAVARPSCAGVLQHRVNE